MISKSQALAYIKHERSQLLPRYWQQGYKIIGYLGGANNKLPWKTPIRRGSLKKKDAQRLVITLVKSDPKLKNQLRLTKTPIGWFPMCGCKEDCTHPPSVLAMRAALKYRLSQAEDLKWCARHHWWWVKGSYGWVPAHSSMEPCGDRYRIPTPLEKAMDGWEEKIPADQPGDNIRAFSLNELRKRIANWLPQGLTRDPRVRDGLVTDFLDKIVSGKMKFPYWCDFEMDEKGRLTQPKSKLGAYLKLAVANFGLDIIREEKREKETTERFERERRALTNTPTPEELLLTKEEVKKKSELHDHILSQLSDLTHKPVEQIKTLIEVREIQDIKTLADELGIERTKLYREVITPARQKAE